MSRSITLLVLVDCKNLALYGGGIAHWFAPLLAAWVESRPNAHFQLLGPDFKQDFLPSSGNWEHVPVAWPLWLPRPLRHPWYDNVLFPRAVARLSPNMVMSPYHDVRMPKAVPSVIGVHDLCLDELPGIYPERVRGYYLAMLRCNLRRANHVITVSQTSRVKLVERYGIPAERISVVYNAASNDFAFAANADDIMGFKFRHAVQGRFLLYTGGSEYRKNVERLVQAFASLAAGEVDLTLLTTGDPDSRWQAAFAKVPATIKGRVTFAGKLSDQDLRLAYAGADAVVYPSLCEGFGRVCLEAMEAGAPLACSDLPVMREVAGDYPSYFDPINVESIISGISLALARQRRDPVKDRRFQEALVKKSFVQAMNEAEKVWF
jgi:glycosyltransferase involved in cell wall biosynthesis